MKVELPPDLEEIVKKNMAMQKSDAVQIIAAALYSYEQNQEVDHFAGWDKDILKREVSLGFEQLDRGEYGENVLDEIIERLESQIKKPDAK
jgi:hypothetical protein